MAARARLTRISKVHSMIEAGATTAAIPSYCALADQANNKAGLCWPSMDTSAIRLKRSSRTIQLHLHLLKERGLERGLSRVRGAQTQLVRSLRYVYRVLHIAAATARQKASRDRYSQRAVEKKIFHHWRRGSYGLD